MLTAGLRNMKRRYCITKMKVRCRIWWSSVTSWKKSVRGCTRIWMRRRKWQGTISWRWKYNGRRLNGMRRRGGWCWGRRVRWWRGWRKWQSNLMGEGRMCENRRKSKLKWKKYNRLTARTTCYLPQSYSMSHGIRSTTCQQSTSWTIATIVVDSKWSIKAHQSRLPLTCHCSIRTSPRHYLTTSHINSTPRTYCVARSLL